MSEYQFYDFYAIDRPLSETQLRELRALSTRAHITPNSFTNHYNFGNFRGCPLEMIKEYFDFFVYDSNWGVRQFMLRLPHGILDPALMKACCFSESFDCQPHGDYVILHYYLQMDDYSWDVIESSKWMPLLIPLRRELLAGDTRPLFLGWLFALQSGEFMEEHFRLFPPPSGLGQLTAAQRSLMDFLEMDEDLLATAQRYSMEREAPFSDPLEFSDWLLDRPAVEKDEILRRLAETDASHLRNDLTARFFREKLAKTPLPTQDTRCPSTLAEWHCQWEKVRRARETQEAITKARQEEQERIEAQKDHEIRLRNLAKNTEHAWKRVENLIENKTQTSYQKAAELIADLLELAERSGDTKSAKSRMTRLRKRHARKLNFIAKLNDQLYNTTPTQKRVRGK